MTTAATARDIDTAADLREALRRAIANGEYAPGVKLVERELTLRYGVGRTGVREALRYLAAEGILELNENRGARVKSLSYSDALDMYQVREELEGLAGQLFAVRGTPEEKIEFAQSLEPVREAMHDGDVTRTLVLSDIYYGHLLRGARNPELHRLIELLHVRINQVRRVSVSMSERAESTLDGLQRIVNAVLVGDPVEARAACIAHVRASAAATLPVLAAWEQQEPNASTPSETARPQSS